MDDWVRAINGVRRKLSEKQEEERNKREAAKTPGIGIPHRDEPHQGSMGASPSGGYFATSPSQVTAATILPAGTTPLSSSPKTTTNTLTSQLARVSIPSGPVNLRMPTSPTLTTGQGARIGSAGGVSGRREPSGGSITSPTEHLPQNRSLSYPPTLSIVTHVPPSGIVSSDDEEGTLGTPAYVQVHSSQIDPNKVILSAYLMKRSKGRGRKLWRKRWFYLTSQGLTYTKSHMVIFFVLDAWPLCLSPLRTRVLSASSHSLPSSMHSSSTRPRPLPNPTRTPAPHPRSAPPPPPQRVSLPAGGSVKMRDRPSRRARKRKTRTEGRTNTSSG